MIATTAKLSRRRLVAAAIVVAVVVAAALSTKRVSTTEANDAAGAQFDATSYVEERWESEILPAIVDGATDLVTVLDAIAADPVAAAETYGHAPGPNSAAGFAVTGTAVVGALDGSIVPITVEGVSDDFITVMQVGPAINGTALRDATGLVTFDEFLNQIEYQRVGTELNERVKDDPLGDIDVAALEGENVTFTGAFLQTTTGLVSIVPVELEVEG